MQAEPGIELPTFQLVDDLLINILTSSFFVSAAFNHFQGPQSQLFFDNDMMIKRRHCSLGKALLICNKQLINKVKSGSLLHN